MISKKLILKSELSFDEVIHRLEKGMSQKFELFTDKIMSGEINGTNINATINPPNSFSDPFKTRVKGEIMSEIGETKLDFKVSFGLVNKLILGVWYLPMILLLQHEKNQNIISFIEIFGMLSIMSFISFILLWLKLKWDKGRLEKWLIKNMKNSKGNDFVKTN